MKILTLTWKYLKSCPWNFKSVRKNFSCITYVKIGSSVGEETLISFTSNIELKSLFLYVKFRKSSWLEISSRLVGILDPFLLLEKKKPIQNFQKNIFSSRENKNPYVKKPKICPRKILLPVKSYKIVCAKAIFCTWKKAKIRFTHTFDFHGKKNAATKKTIKQRQPTKYFVTVN